MHPHMPETDQVCEICFWLWCMPVPKHMTVPLQVCAVHFGSPSAVPTILQ